MKRLIYYFTGLTVLLLLSCMKDKGTYHYVELPELAIDTLKNKTIEIFDTLKIDPKIISQLNTDKLTYCWYRYTGDELAVDTLSQQRQLNYKISFKVGSYIIYLKVTDPESGLSAKEKFILQVEGKFAKGLMILGKVDGATNIQFLNSAGNMTEVCGADLAARVGQNPKIIADASSTISYLKDMLVLCQDNQGGVTLNGADLTISGAFSKQFFLTPEVIHPEAYYKGVDKGSGYGAMADFIINNGLLHTRQLGAIEQLGQQTAFNPAISGDYKLSRWAIVNGKGYLFYDNKGERFLSIKGNMMSINRTFASLTTTSANFDPSKMNMELIYMAECAANGSQKRGMGIFKDKKGQFVRLIFSLGDFRQAGAPLNLLKTDVINGSAIGVTTANSYAMSLAKPFLFYSDGNKIYQYEFESNRAIAIFDSNEKYPNSKIDKIYMEYVPTWDGFGSSKVDDNNTLYVSCSTPGSGKTGTILVLKLNESGTVAETVATYSNSCGTTVDMCYKR